MGVPVLRRGKRKFGFCSSSVKIVLKNPTPHLIFPATKTTTYVTMVAYER